MSFLTKYYGKLKGGQWVGVDLDGCLAFHERPFKGIEHIGAPIPEMVARIKRWRAEGTRVKIFTARASKAEAIPYIEAYCLEHIGEVLKVTNAKDLMMMDLWDDRCVSVKCNTGEVYGGEDLIEFVEEYQEAA